MNFIGKTFVILTGTTSLFCLILATAIYTQKMNFVTPKGEDPKKLPPLVEKSIAKTKELIAANNRAYSRWVQNLDEVPKLEVELYKRRQFYNGQLELVQTGELDGKAVDNPIQALEYDDAALKQAPPRRIVKIDKPTGRESVKVPPSSPDAVEAKTPHFYSLKVYGLDREKLELQKKTEDIAHKMLADSLAINGTADFNALMLSDKDLELVKKLVAEALGLKGIDKPFLKGLRERIKEQEHAAKIADEERVDLEDPITTRRADSQIYVKRYNALKTRIASLGKPGGQGN